MSGAGGRKCFAAQIPVACSDWRRQNGKDAMKRLVPVLVVVALLGAFGFWWFSPVQVVKRRTQTLLETLTLDASAGRPVRQMGVYSLNALLSTEVALNTPTIPEANGVFERSEMESAFSWLCQHARQTRFKAKEFHHIRVAGDEAQVDFLLEGLVELPSYRPADGFYEVTFRWRMEEGSWRLARADWRELGR